MGELQALHLYGFIARTHDTVIFAHDPHEGRVMGRTTGEGGSATHHPARVWLIGKNHSVMCSRFYHTFTRKTILNETRHRLFLFARNRPWMISQNVILYGLTIANKLYDEPNSNVSLYFPMSKFVFQLPWKFIIIRKHVIYNKQWSLKNITTKLLTK